MALTNELVYSPPPGLPPVHHVDAVMVVADKPSGLLSVPGRLPQHHDSALLRLQAEYGPLWVVHRLDMDTSGVMVFARTREAAAALGRQFERRLVHKEYEALVWGPPPSRIGVIDLPLRLDWPHRPRQIIDPVLGKPSLTRYERAGHPPEFAGAGQNHCRLRLFPLTGRSHQLRMHLSAIGHPIVGDRFYGHPQEAEDSRASPRLMLHARHLRLQHPTHHNPMSLSVPVPF
jgi:tRNA pseudouridine32 synthase/23S rRNA pseudouridine746 synthase